MNHPEKRIVITEVYGGCRNLRITDEGTYCAAYIHGGWEKIEPDACDHCQREKYMSGKSREEILKIAARAIMPLIPIDREMELIPRYEDALQLQKERAKKLATVMLNALLEVK